MEVKLVVVNKGWAVSNGTWAAFGETQQDAIDKFKSIVARHIAMLVGEHKKEKEPSELQVRI